MRQFHFFTSFPSPSSFCFFLILEAYSLGITNTAANFLVEVRERVEQPSPMVDKTDCDKSELKPLTLRGWLFDAIWRSISDDNLSFGGLALRIRLSTVGKF